jgi:predicted type IV restriction endonuclease
VINAAQSGARLPESDTAEMDVFLDNVFQLLPILGIGHFRTTVEKTSTESEVLFCIIKTLVASGKRTPNGFMVFKGSRAVLEHRPSARSVRAKREELIKSGVLKRHENHLIFTKDMEFGSPSMAAGVIRGGNSNGLDQWKNSEGQSLKQIERIPD